MIAIGVPAEGDDEPRIGLTPETVEEARQGGRQGHGALGRGAQVAFLR